MSDWFIYDYHLLLSNEKFPECGEIGKEWLSTSLELRQIQLQRRRLAIAAKAGDIEALRPSFLSVRHVLAKIGRIITLMTTLCVWFEADGATCSALQCHTQSQLIRVT